MRTENGYLVVARPRGVALRVHWSTPVVALLLGNLSFEPLLWLCFAVIVLVHELGHAILVRSLGLRVVGIDLTGVGGECRWRGSASGLERAVVAWGGVLAQMLLLLVALLARWFLGPPETAAGFLAWHAFTETNLWIAAVNLLPIPPLDGALAWTLFGQLSRSGLSFGGLLLSPLSGWARRRRRSRGHVGVEPPPSAPPPAAGVRWPRRARRRVPVDADAAREVEDVGTTEAPKPSAEAQRELADLLERISRDAKQARRRDR